jgi:hypothetical protein
LIACQRPAFFILCQQSNGTGVHDGNLRIDICISIRSMAAAASLPRIPFESFDQVELTFMDNFTLIDIRPPHD